jgi:hypothetical protein
MKEVMEMEYKESWRLAMDEEMDEIIKNVHGTWSHCMIKGNPLDVNGCSKRRSV